MPSTRVVYFCEEDGSAPALDFLVQCGRQDRRIVAKLREKIARLAELGWELRRPEADTLRDGIHELRVGFGGVNYRLLYSLHREPDCIALLSNGCTKEDVVPPKEIDFAVARKDKFEADPERHTYEANLP